MGFEIFKADPPMSGVGLHQDLKMKSGESAGNNFSLIQVSPKLSLRLLRR